MTTGEQKLKETADKIRADVAAEQEAKANEKKDLTEAKTIAVSQMQALSQNHELSQLYNDNAEVGSENLGGSLPLLKVHATGKSTKNQLADGTEPTNGWFFYKPTGEQFKEVVCHILTISRGYTAPDMNGKDKFTQLMAGVIVNDGQFKPFIIYMTGMKLANMWDFGKEAKKYTHAKPVSIPMFALTIKLTTEQKVTTFGLNWIINFEILKTAGKNEPLLILDPGLFTALKDNVSEVKETIDNLIKDKSTENGAEEHIEAIQTENPVVNDGPYDASQDVHPDEIPF